MVKIRKANIDDLEQLLDCEKSVWESLQGLLSEEFLEEELKRYKSTEVKERTRRFMESPNSIVLVAEEKDQIVGFVEGSVRAGVSRLGIIGVRVEYRRRGIGHKLLEEFIKESIQKGAHKVYLWTPADLKYAIMFYINAGFVPEGFLRKHFYRMDMIILSRFLE